MHKRAVYLYGLFKGEKDESAMKSVTYANMWHEGHKRDDGTDYFEHPLRVCNLLLNLNNTKIVTPPVKSASLLHDSIEDKRITVEEFKAIFGVEILYLVLGLTKIEGESKEETFNRVEKDPRLILIKGADRFHNISSMVLLAEMNGDFDRLKRYIEDTEKYVLPMLKRGRRIYLDYSDAFTLFGENIDNVIKIAKAYIRAEERARKAEGWDVAEIQKQEKDNRQLDFFQNSES